MALFYNFAFVAAFLGIIIAQLLKVILNYVAHRHWHYKLSLSSGGMPSSHSAAVASLTTSVGIMEGVSSAIFAVSAIFSIIIMYDAAGIRKHAGNQAVYLNKLITEFQYLFQELRHLNLKEDKQKVLKELIGHQPNEVVVGALLGVGISFLCNVLIYHY